MQVFTISDWRYAIHLRYYILHDLTAYVKILPYELITERTEKWATPTFLLVIDSAARKTELET